MFLDAHSRELTCTYDSDLKHIWKWLPLMDRAVVCTKGSPGLLEKCARVLAQCHKSNCIKENLRKLSKDSLAVVAAALAGK